MSDLESQKGMSPPPWVLWVLWKKKQALLVTKPSFQTHLFALCIDKCMYVFTYPCLRNAYGVCMWGQGDLPWCTCGGLRKTSGVGSLLPPYLLVNVSLASATVYTPC